MLLVLVIPICIVFLAFSYSICNFNYVIPSETMLRQKQDVIITENPGLIRNKNIEIMGQINLKAEQEQKIINLKKEAKYCFKVLAWRYFGLSDINIQQLSDKEVNDLFNLVSQKANADSFKTKIALTASVVGWFAVGKGQIPDVWFVMSINKLKKSLGNNFDPVELIRGNYEWGNH